MTLILLLAGLALGALPGTASAMRHAGHSKFQPASGKTLLILGQDLDAIADYDRNGRVRPFGYATYTSLKDLNGLTEPSDVGGGRMFAEKVHREHPGAALQLGLYVVGDLEAIASGARDSNIAKLARFLSGLDVPVFLRFGYEFDYPENRYEPESYKAAFRHFVLAMRGHRCANVAFVWHSYADERSRPLMDWYPGDEFVDWCAISYFRPGLPEQEDMARFAAEHGKALMIAESAPWHLPHEEAWGRWFRPALGFIEKHDVSAWCYINCDWGKIPIFRSKGWGDTRLSASPSLLLHWNELAAIPRFQP